MKNDSNVTDVLSPLDNDLLLELARQIDPDFTESSLLSFSVHNPRTFGIISDFANLVNYCRQGGKL